MIVPPVGLPQAMPEVAPLAVPELVVETFEAGGVSAERLQRAAVDALSAAKSQASAADAVADAIWTMDSTSIAVQTELSKTMLGVVLNPEAEKILRGAVIAAGGAGLKLQLLPGMAAQNGDSAKKIKPARAGSSGSAQARAMEHPVVQQAQRLFNAEIRNVIDLSEE